MKGEYSNTYFYNNYAEVEGGGLALKTGTFLNINNCAFLNNTSNLIKGGGFYLVATNIISITNT